MPARFTGMIPESFDSDKKHPQSSCIKMTAGQVNAAIGRPQITNSEFEQALVTSIRQSQIFARVVGDDQIKGDDFILTVTLFSLDKRVFGQMVRLEAGWTLQRMDTGMITWRQSIISEFKDPKRATRDRRCGKKKYQAGA